MMHDVDEAKYPPEFVRGMVKTVNKMGITTLEMARPTQAFVDYAAHCKKPVLDIGCGYGVSSLAALKTGARVIAFDLAKEHLQVLMENTPTQFRKNLTTQVGRFPENLHFEPESLSAVHAAMILHFLDGDVIIAGLKKCFQALEPGGNLFLGNMTPYLGIYHLDALAKEYQQRLANGEKWPGYIEHIRFVKAEWKNDLPVYAHLLKLETVVQLVTAAGFEVEDAYYYTLESLAEAYKNNGKEYVGIRAAKVV